MALNIKNSTTEALVKELAARTGESQTAAITAAVRERLERLRPPSLERMRAIADDCAARLSQAPHRLEIDDLYNDQGLFK
ncbi:MAG: type II toxin-antitoxin system VapB family antitoxin [Terriglobales bacterium]